MMMNYGIAVHPTQGSVAPVLPHAADTKFTLWYGDIGVTLSGLIERQFAKNRFRYFQIFCLFSSMQTFQRS